VFLVLVKRKLVVRNDGKQFVPTPENNHLPRENKLQDNYRNGRWIIQQSGDEASSTGDISNS